MPVATHNRILAVLFLGVLMGALDIAIVGPALPAIQAQFQLDSRQLVWIFNIYVLFNLVSAPIMAKLSDRYGRRRIYNWDIGLFASGSLLVALAPSFELLLVGRAVQAIGAGGIFPVASAVIGDTFPVEKRGSALGMIGAVFGLAFLLGPVLGGLLLQASWHWLFLINLPLAAIVLWQSIKHIPETTRAASAPLDLRGVVVLATGLGLLTVGISRLDVTDLAGSALGLGQGLLVLVGLLLAPLFWWVERNAADPLLPPALFRSRQVALTSAFALAAGLTEGALVFLPALAVAAMGVTDSVASFMLLPIILTLAVGSPLAGRLLDKIGSRIVVQAGLGFTAAGLLLFRADVSSLVVFYSAGALVGFGLSALLGAPLRYILLNEVSAANRGSAQGLLTVFTSIGQLFGGALVGAIAAASGGGALGYQQSLMALGVITAALLLTSGGLKSRVAERAAGVK